MTTPILDLEEWESAQAQPEVTVNEAVRWLECFASLSVASLSVNDPPSASDGDRYIVGSSPTGVWAGHASQVALFMGSAWGFRTAPEGAIAWVDDEAAAFRYLSGVWTDASPVIPPADAPPIYQLTGSIILGALTSPRFFVPVAGHLERWILHVEGGPADCVVDIRLSTSGAASPPTGPGDSICNGLPPTVTAAHGADNDCTPFTTQDVLHGDILEFVLLSSDTNVSAIHFQLNIQPEAP